MASATTTRTAAGAAASTTDGPTPAGRLTTAGQLLGESETPLKAQSEIHLHDAQRPLKEQE
jgi:hypothetical protein